jgi:hypothetical protein
VWGIERQRGPAALRADKALRNAVPTGAEAGRVTAAGRPAVTREPEN